MINQTVINKVQTVINKVVVIDMTTDFCGSLYFFYDDIV